MEITNIENTKFKQIYVDVNSVCNMSCANCYAATRTSPDITTEYFEEVCKRLPHKVAFRLLGGEPTLSENLFDIIKIAHKYHHLPLIVTNGKKLIDIDYCSELKKAGYCGVAISLDGGIENDDIYNIIQGEPCLDFKLKAVKNLVEVGIRRIGICAIILRGINDDFIIKHLLRLKDRYPKYIRYMHLRTLAPFGKYIKSSKPYTFQEMSELLGKYIDISKGAKRPQFEECVQCGGCDRFSIDSFEYSIISFGNLACKIRGQLLPNFELAPFFEYMKLQNEGKI